MRIVFISFLIGCVFGAKLPSDFQRCKRKDIVCLRAAIQDAIPKFANGFKSMAIPGLDPLSIPFMEIPGGTNAVRINQKLSNGILYGLSSAKIEDMSFDLDSGNCHWIFTIPNITILADYEMTGQILVLPVNGKGKMTVTIEDVKADETLKIVSYEKNKKKYDRVQDTVLKMEAGHVTFNLDNVFDGNKELSDQINQVMNENWKSVFDELKDGYNDAIKRFTDNIVNRFFAKIADNDIFLD